MGGTTLESAQVEKDFGVIVDQSLSGSNECAVAVKKKANSVTILPVSVFVLVY